jgi:endonuclease/exonuclease/phosphatase (EEP) superfamily protein YafD
VQYAVVGALLAVAATLVRLRPLAAVAGTVAVVNLVGLLPALLADARPDPRRTQLRLLVANVWFPGSHYDRLGALVERDRPDVVGLTELTPEWAEGVEPFLREYRHRLVAAERGSHGVGIYSRVPLRGTRLVTPGGEWPPFARATVDAGGRPLELFVVHAPGAFGRWRAARHRTFLPEVGGLARAAGPRVLVCGDLNAAPWTRSYRQLRARGRLERADPWRPLEWTFPRWAPPLGTPIDQCLAGAAVHVSTRVGDDFGSDHLPLLVGVEVP